MKHGKLLLITMILSVCLVFSFMTGCDKSDEDASSNDTSQNTTTEPTGETADATPEPTPEIVLDMNGRIIRYNAWFTLEPTRGVSDITDMFMDKMDNVMAKNNFSIEFVNTDYETTKNNISSSVLAGDPMYDVSMMDRRWLFPGYFLNNILTPIDDLKYIDISNPKWNKFYTETGTYKGVCYATYTGKMYPRGVFFFNKNIFEKAGLPDLYEIVANKQWNWDKLRELSAAAKKDEDNDGTIDIWGFNGMSGVESQFVLSNNAKIVRFEDNGRAVFSLGESNGLEALQFMQDMKTKLALWENNPPGAEWYYPRDAFNDGKIAILGGSYWFTDKFYQEMVDDYGIIYTPMGPRADEYVVVADDYNLAGFPAGIKNPEEIGFFYNVWTDPTEGAPDDPDAWKTGYHESRCRDDASIENIRQIVFSEVSTVANDMAYFNDIINLSYTFYNEILTGSKSPEASMQEVTPQAQAILDEFLKE